MRQYGEIIKDSIPSAAYVERIDIPSQSKLVETETSTKAIDQMANSKALKETATQKVLQES